MKGVSAQSNLKPICITDIIVSKNVYINDKVILILLFEEMSI